MAYQLAHEYGNYFTLYYFNLIGDTESIENDPYFKLRYNDDYDIRYLPEEFEDSMNYYGTSERFLYEIAAADYVYLMGSPNVKIVRKYLDTYDTLRLDVYKKQDELDAYNEYYYSDSFNKSPHENALLPFPDQIEGLPELFFNAIGLNSPKYEDHTKEAKNIEIKIEKQFEHGKSFYLVTWNKPWEDEDVTYTLVGYTNENWNEGAIKSITGKERARAIIGGAVVDRSTSYTWLDDDFWSLKEEPLNFRVIVTFSDGTAVISPSIDWSPT